MPVLSWNNAGDRRFASGVDRGVFYFPSGEARAWNGLVSVTDTSTGTVTPYYLDGVKYREQHMPGEYAAKLKAFTYPDELEDRLGHVGLLPGLQLHDGPAQPFNLSYRTQLGNDLSGLDYGYRIHVVYNVLATPSDITSETIGADVTAEPFEFSLTGTPVRLTGQFPTNHISVDSRWMDPEKLELLESILYGSDTDPAHLPSLPDLLAQLA